MRRLSVGAIAIAAMIVSATAVFLTGQPAQAHPSCDGSGSVTAYTPGIGGYAQWQPYGEHLCMGPVSTSPTTNVVVWYRVNNGNWYYNTYSGTGGHTDKEFAEGLDFDFYVCLYRASPYDKYSCSSTHDSTT